MHQGRGSVPGNCCRSRACLPFHGQIRWLPRPRLSGLRPTRLPIWYAFALVTGNNFVRLSGFLLKIARVGWVCCPFFTLSCFAAPYRQCFTQCASIFHGLSLSGVSCGVHLHTNARWRMCVCMCLCVCVWVSGAYVCVNWVYVIKDVLCCGFDGEFWLKKKIYIFI